MISYYEETRNLFELRSTLI